MSIDKLSRRASLFLIILAAFVIRLFLILKRAPAGDEIWAWLLTKASLKDIWLGTFADLIPPFYFLFLRAVSLISGFSLNIFSLRLISLLFWILASLGTGYLGFYVLGKNTGLIAFLLSLFLPSSIWVAVYARFYAFLILLTVFALFVLIRFLEKGKSKDLVFLTGISVLGVYTHYYFFLLVLSFGIYLFLVKKKHRFVKKWLYSFLCLLVLFSPGLYYFFSLPKPWAVRLTSHWLKIPAALLANLTSFEALVYAYSHQSFLANLLFFAPFLICSLALLVLGLKKWKSDLAVLFLLVIVFPPTFAFLASFIFKLLLGLESVLVVNSLLIFLPAFIIVLAKGIDFALGKKKVLVLIFLIFVFFSQILFWRYSAWYSIFALPFKFVEDELGEDDLVLHADIYTYIQTKYYLKKDVNFGVISTTYPAQTEKALGYKMIPQETVFSHQGGIWYFEPRYYNVTEAKEFKTKLDENLFIIKERKFKDSLINVYLYLGKSQ